MEIGLGDTALARGDLAVAEQHYRHALQDARNVDMPWLVAASLAGLASVAARRSEPERAGRLWGAWKRFEQDGGVDLLAHETMLYDDALATVAGPEFNAAANAIRGAEPDDALAAALADGTGAAERNDPASF